jgi:hypothetical protein
MRSMWLRRPRVRSAVQISLGAGLAALLLTLTPASSSSSSALDQVFKYFIRLPGVTRDGIYPQDVP